MNIFRLFVKPKSASTARERLQVLLAHERASVGGNDLVALLRDEILAVISKHVKVDDNKVYVKLERGTSMSRRSRSMSRFPSTHAEGRPDGRPLRFSMKSFYGCAGATDCGDDHENPAARRSASKWSSCLPRAIG
jgi:cell division topological specificity factor